MYTKQNSYLHNKYVIIQSNNMLRTFVWHVKHTSRSSYFAYLEYVSVLSSPACRCIAIMILKWNIVFKNMIVATLFKHYIAWIWVQIMYCLKFKRMILIPNSGLLVTSFFFWLLIYFYETLFMPLNFKY